MNQNIADGGETIETNDEHNGQTNTSDGVRSCKKRSKRVTADADGVESGAREHDRVMACVDSVIACIKRSERVTADSEERFTSRSGHPRLMTDGGWVRDVLRRSETLSADYPCPTCDRELARVDRQVYVCGQCGEVAEVWT